MYVRFAAFIPGIEDFDESLFRVSQSEAASMDPQGRMLLEQTHLALRDAETCMGQAIPNHTGV